MSLERKKVDSKFEQLINCRAIPFPSLGQHIEAPTEKGVYLILGRKGAVLHVGRTPRAHFGIRQRIRAHLAGRSSFVQMYLDGDGSALRQGHKFKYVIVKNPRHRALLEAYAIGQLLPKHIGVG